MRMQGNDPLDDVGTSIPLAFPVLSFFDRIPPAKNDKTSSAEAFTLLRRGMHNLNMSQALEAGEMVVLAEVFYQFALPIERIEPPPPAPTTAPATTIPAVQSPAPR
jgi:hypothetical protein